MIVAGQYNNDLTIEKLYSSMKFDVIYAPLTSTDFVPPSILSAGARKVIETGFDGLEFSVGAFDDEGVARVLVTYLESGQNTWKSKDLDEDLTSGGWFGRVAGLDISTPYFVQACDNNGNCIFTADKSDYLVGSRPNPFTNAVDDSHTFTITVWKDEGNGLALVDGVTPEVTLDTLFGASVTIIKDTCLTGTGGLDNEPGQCTVEFTSSSTGAVSAHADVEVDVLSLVLHRSTNGDLGNSLDAIKKYVNATVSLGSTGYAVVGGEPFPLTVEVKKDLGDGSGSIIPVANQVVEITLTNISDENDVVTKTCTTNDEGLCSTSITSDSAKTYKGFATVTDVDVDGLVIDSITSDPPITVHFVDGRVVIEQEGEFQGIGEDHTLKITAELFDGTGWNPVPFTSPVFVVIPDLDQNVTDSIDCSEPTEPFTQCLITISGDSDGVVTITVTVTFTVNGAVFTRSSTATVTFVSGSLTWYKVDENGTPLAGATFEACRVAERPGTTPVVTDPECFTVLDNQDPDMNMNDGEFRLEGLMLGTWEVRETSAPNGYLGDFGRVEPIELTIASPDRVISNPWVNRIAGQILETGTTCEQYVDGTAIELNEVIYRVNKKDGSINNVAPGVFFYYTTFTAPSADFDVMIEQSSSPAFTDFYVQNSEQVRLFNGDCSNPTATFTSSINGDVTANITGANAGDVFVMSIKYETGNVVGLPDPDFVHYSYSTVIATDVVDKNSNGLDLVKRGN